MRSPEGRFNPCLRRPARPRRFEANACLHKPETRFIIGLKVGGMTAGDVNA